ncbi:MAG: leucine-rich repeat protein [Clostridiales bacterium]|nr:leucine-rich repeat protein [Clostridiales bacterium]
MKLKKVMLTLTLVFVTGAFQMPVHAAEESGQVTAQENEQSVDATEAQETDTEVIGETLGANTEESDFTWNGTIITGYNGSATDVVIPKRATGIAQDAFSGKAITSLKFEGDNLTDIGNFAFNNCTSLKSVTFPSSLKT